MARYTGKHRAPVQPRRILSRAVSGYVAASVLVLAFLAVLVSLAIAGSKAEDIPATTAPVALVDQGEPETSMVTLPATTATVTLPATTLTMPPVVATVTESPAPITATITAEPMVTTTTEYPADVIVTERPAAATVTSTIERAPVTEYATQDAAPRQDASSDFPACANEDGSDGPFPCYWDGGSNGTGESYVVWSDDQF